MIKQLLRNWLGIQELSDKLALHNHSTFTIASNEPYEFTSSNIATEPQEVVKGYEH